MFKFLEKCEGFLVNIDKSAGDYIMKSDHGSDQNQIRSETGHLSCDSGTSVTSVATLMNNNVLETSSSASNSNANGLSHHQENNLLEQEIQTLQKEIRQSKQAQKEAEKKTESLLESLHSLEELISALKKENVALADEITRNTHNAKLKHFQAQHSQQTQKAQQAAEKLSEQLSTLKKENETLVNMISDKEIEICNINAELESEKQKRQAIETENKDKDSGEGVQPSELLIVEKNSTGKLDDWTASPKGAKNKAVKVGQPRFVLLADKENVESLTRKSEQRAERILRERWMLEILENFENAVLKYVTRRTEVKKVLGDMDRLVALQHW